MRLSQLRDAKVRTLDGKTLGRVHEVHVEKGRVTALTCGPGSWIERMTSVDHGRRIPWQFVVRIAHRDVIVTTDPPQRVSASRTRQGTRRASARRSKR
jgi:sporulation protein YlmC with PRC-barrel domain